MRYWVKRIETIRRILAALSGGVLLLSGLGALAVDLNRRPSPPQEETRVKPIAGLSGMTGEEAGGETLLAASAILSFGFSNLRYLLVKTAHLTASLILWAVLTVFLQELHRSADFLIRFIHNSDGKKRKWQIL